MVSALLIGLSTNLDNLCTAVFIGMQKKRISLLSNIIISLISGSMALLSSKIATFIIPGRYASLIGGLLIAGMGIWTIISAFKTNGQDNLEFENLNLSKSILLGFALAVNCMPVSFGAGAGGLPPLWISLSITVTSFLSIEIGVRIGHKLGRYMNSGIINAISGLLLIALGTLEAMELLF